MSTELETKLAEEICERVGGEGFIRLTLSRSKGLGPRRESIRPVIIAGNPKFQRETFDGKKVIVKNYDFAPIEELLGATGAREYHLMTAKGDLHVRITKKGKNLVTRGAPTISAAVKTEHDHRKDLPLARFDFSALLAVLKPSPAKLTQINAFLSEIDSVVDGNSISIVDCGCGRAYLTFAAYAYLTQFRNVKTRILGIDRNAPLIAQCREMARALDCEEDVRFVEDDIASAEISGGADLLMSLHACDTATDAAIAKGVAIKARAMLVAPCCQHDLQQQLASEGPLRGIMRNGILRERFADILTDTFRAQLLRTRGYRVKIVEFVTPDATPRNILLRATYVGGRAAEQTREEYDDLKKFCNVTPVLEKLLEQNKA